MKVGMRPFIIYIVGAIAIGALAISLSLKLDEHERIHSVAQDNQ
jgi:hypothetical protein